MRCIAFAVALLAWSQAVAQARALGMLDTGRGFFCLTGAGQRRKLIPN
jgi:hypothetical protein